jgi:GAF domain-containing protein
MTTEMAGLEQAAEIARRLAEEEDLDGLLQRAVDLGQAYLDGCDGVSVMLILKGGRVSTPAFSAALAEAGDRAQHEAQDGPCLEAIREHHTVIIDDLGSEERWPGFSELALALGVRSMVSTRLFIREDTMGSLNFYSLAPHTFGQEALMYGQVFSSHVAVALKAAITESGLASALETRDIIGQAKGVVMAREALGADAAFEVLRQRSQELNVPLRSLAEDVARTGAVPEAGDGARTGR